MTQSGRTLPNLRRLAEEWSFSLADGELDALTAVSTEVLDSVDRTVGLVRCGTTMVRDSGAPASRDEDPYNAIVRWCDVRREDVTGGPLSGMRIALKDCIAIAGVPLTGGSALLDGFVPGEDSAVASRVLAAGGHVVAVTNMDSLAWSGGGDTSVYGPVLCPYDVGRTATGSSGGSAAAVHYRSVDAAFGCDQGGSTRLPAAACGLLGLKPTYGVIAYTGILGTDPRVDHVGPIAATAEHVARLVDATAGPDFRDRRQRPDAPVESCTRAVREALPDLRHLDVAVVTEALDGPVPVDEEVRHAFWESIDRLTALGARVREVSIPEHLTGGDVNLVECIEGFRARMSAIAGGAVGQLDDDLPDAVRFLAERYGERADLLSPQAKLVTMLGVHVERSRAAARRLHRELCESYDRALAVADVLAMPTAPWLPPRLDDGASPAERILRGWRIATNTAATNLTGHPAITLPVVGAGGLPVGTMLVGMRYTDHQLLATAQTVETGVGWFDTRSGDGS